MVGAAMSDLTARELEVLREFADGSTRKEVAARLGVGPGTIRTALTRIYRKLGVTTLIGAFRARGWILVDGDRRAFLDKANEVADTARELLDRPLTYTDWTSGEPVEKEWDR